MLMRDEKEGKKRQFKQGHTNTRQSNTARAPKAFTISHALCLSVMGDTCTCMHVLIKDAYVYMYMYMYMCACIN